MSKGMPGCVGLGILVLFCYGLMVFHFNAGTQIPSQIGSSNVEPVALSNEPEREPNITEPGNPIFEIVTGIAALFIFSLWFLKQCGWSSNPAQKAWEEHH